jgi:hypothetical protein
MMDRLGGRIAPGAALAALALAAPAGARDALGIFGNWGAFRETESQRCFAMAEPAGRPGDTGKWRPFAAIGWWPKQGVRGQVNIRLAREIAPGSVATLTIGAQRFALVGGGADLWAKDRQGDAAIIAAMRSGETMTVHARARDGGPLSDRYQLRGAATAIDAAALGCARIR